MVIEEREPPASHGHNDSITTIIFFLHADAFDSYAPLVLPQSVEPLRAVAAAKVSR